MVNHACLLALKGLIISVTPSLDHSHSHRKSSLVFCINDVVDHTFVSSEVVNHMD